VFVLFGAEILTLQDELRAAGDFLLRRRIAPIFDGIFSVLELLHWPETS